MLMVSGGSLLLQQLRSEGLFNKSYDGKKMDKLIKHFSIALLMVLGGSHNPCSADVSLKLYNSFSFTKSTSTIEHLDHKNYINTQVTSGWTEAKEVTTYAITPELLWFINSINTYVECAVNYGWVLGGRNKNYPFRWDIDGDTKGCAIETGYLLDVCERFTFIPHVGFNYNVLDTKIKHQEFSNNNIGSFISQNGNKTHTSLYSPYIGFEIEFKSKICDKDIQCSFDYSLGYITGHGRTKVHHVVITDLASTSRYGSHVKYRDIISQDFEFSIAYSPAKKWVLALEFDYNYYYNTKKLPLKLQRNKELVAAGQFTASQFHRVSDLVAHSYAIIFVIGYRLSGEGGGAFISH